MKKMTTRYMLSATAIMLLASCTNDTFVGEIITPDEGTHELQNVIAIGGKGRSFTRAANHTGADAAGLLNNQFVVEGAKTVADARKEVFDDFIVKWSENSAGTTESNTSDWEYVGLTALAPSDIAGTIQAIKYWDYEASQYDFAAYSTSTASAITTGTPTAGQVLVSAIDYDNLATAAYTIQGATDDLAKCYIADLITAYNPTVAGQPAFMDEVTFNFRNLSSKVRMAIYETVPGYSVKDVKFYTVDGGAAPTDLGTATETKATLFTTGTTAADKFFTSGKYTVFFPTMGSAKVSETDYNKAHVTFAADATDGAGIVQNYGELNYVGKEYNEKTGTEFIGRTSGEASFAGDAATKYWKTVLPNEDGTVLELRVDYTLEAIDGTGEETHVYGATAYVPANMAAWKSNYAYTYIFKISDATNGWTSKVPTDPKGLYPITFDAVVTDAVEGAEQTTVTTIATPSITTYQKGHLYTDGPEYSAAKGDIYVQVMASALATDLASKGQLYTVSDATATEAEVLAALNLGAVSVASGYDVTGRNGVSLKKATSNAAIEAIPGVNGNDIKVTAGSAASFTPAEGLYAYVYTVKDADQTETITTAVSIAADFDFDAAKAANANDIYYLEEDCSGTPVTGTAAADGIYYQKYAKNNGVYAVKVIKVVG